MALPKKGANKAPAPRSDYEVIPGGHVRTIWPEEIIVATAGHFLHDYADPERTDPNHPGMQSLVAFIRDKGVPGRPIVWQKLRPDGGVDSYMVDGRRRRAARLLLNQELATKGLTGERLEVMVRNDLNDLQLRELVAESNEGAEPPSLAQRIRQASSLVEEYRRIDKVMHPERVPDEVEIGKRAARRFRGATGDTILRWMQVGRLVHEAQALIFKGRVPIEVVDTLSVLEPDSQREAIACASEAKNPKAAKAAIENFGGNLGAEKESTKTRKGQPLSLWQQLDRVLQAHPTPDEPLVSGAREVLRFRRCEIELPELLRRLGMSPPKVKCPPLRNPRERAAYDAAVLGALKRGDRPMLAVEIGTEVGGTALQVRASLVRLMRADCVTCTGKAAGTRYEAVKGAVLARSRARKRAKSAPGLKSPAARHAYALAIFEAIKDERACSVPLLRKAVGGTSSEVRAALAELVSAASIESREKETYRAIGEPPSLKKVKALDVQIAIRLEQAAADERITRAQLAEELQVDVKKVSASVDRLVQDGLVIRHSHGRGSWYASASAMNTAESKDAEVDDHNDDYYDCADADAGEDADDDMDGADDDDLDDDTDGDADDDMDDDDTDGDADEATDGDADDDTDGDAAADDADDASGEEDVDVPQS